MNLLHKTLTVVSHTSFHFLVQLALYNNMACIYAWLSQWHKAESCLSVALLQLVESKYENEFDLYDESLELIYQNATLLTAGIGMRSAAAA
jgi:hypothetical protein